MTGASAPRGPSWDGVRTPVPLNEPISLGGLLVGAFLSVITLGIFLLLALRDWWRRPEAIDRDGIVCRSGLLPWSELEDTTVETRQGGRVGRLTSMSIVQLRFATRTIEIWPWSTPHPQLVLRALAAGLGKPIDVPRPRGFD